MAQVQEKLAALLVDYKLNYEKLIVTATTRRLAAYVVGLAPHQPDEVVEKKGPSADRAYDAEGKPTKAAQGFARGQGIDVADLELRDNYVWAVQKVTGQAASAVLPGLLTALMDSLRWRKVMRWNTSNQGYPRPLRWIVALYGDQIVPFTWAGVTSGRISRGPRFADAAATLPAGGFTTFEIADSQAYFSRRGRARRVLDRSERQAAIAALVEKTAVAAGGITPEDADLLNEVTDLVEAPFAVLGSFERKFLDLPKPVLIGVMKKHQRYFPLVDPETGALLPNFITIANSRELAHPEVVKAGNEGVIRARYADAAFFYRQDTGRKLESFTPRLATLTFHEKLGSMLDKVQRMEKLAPQLAQNLGGSAQDLTTVARAAALSKSDLVTSMVVEMTSLQGIMGEYYALNAGETPAVAQAIREHYLPRSAGDATPASLPGLALSLADKLDSIAGFFGAGLQPTGSADPLGLRRSALGMVYNLLAAEADFSLNQALAQAAALQPIDIAPSALADAHAFVERRLQGVLLEMGFAHDVVEAVVAVRGDNPFAALQACRAVSAAVVTTVVERRPSPPMPAAPASCAAWTTSLPLASTAYTEEVERDLHAAYMAAAQTLADAEDAGQALGDVLHGSASPHRPLLHRSPGQRRRRRRASRPPGPDPTHRPSARRCGGSEQIARILTSTDVQTWVNGWGRR